MRTRTMAAVLAREGGGYVAENPETGLASQGRTVDEAVKNLKEAVGLYPGEFPPEQPDKWPPRPSFGARPQ